LRQRRFGTARRGIGRRVALAALAAASVLGVAWVVPSAGASALTGAPASTSTGAFAWGYNFWGQTGFGPAFVNGGKQWQLFPAPVSRLPRQVVQVAQNDSGASAAVLSDGSVWTWGNTGHCSFLGDGVTANRSEPARVTQLPASIIRVAVSNSHILALASDGSVYSWGCNDDGQLGTGAVTPGLRPTPVRATVVSGVVEVAAGDGFSVALKANGEVWTWGRGLEGNLGNDTTTGSVVAVRANTPHSIAHVAAHGESVIAVRSLAVGGAVYTWGDNQFGQLGTGSTAPFNAHPTREKAALSGVIQIATSGRHALVVRSDGTVWGWGLGTNGEFGTPSAGPVRAPVQVLGLSGITQVAAGAGQNLAVSADGTVLAWGLNSDGMLGNGTQSGPTVAVPVPIARVHGTAQASTAAGTFLVIADSVDPLPTS